MKNLVIIFACMLLIASCKTKSDPVDDFGSSHKIFVRYYDSNCKSAMDTVTLHIHDTITLSHATGYYRIASPDGSFFEVGQLRTGKKSGVWKSYTFWNVIPKQTLNTMAKYKDGKLNGKYLTFTRDSIPIESFFYVGDKQVGKQTEYDTESGKPALLYETNNDGQFINDYLALSRTGDTLYHTNFGKDATGYEKRYDRWGILISEGKMIKGKQKAFISYDYDYEHERYSSARHYTVTDTSLILQWAKHYPENVMPKK